MTFADDERDPHFMRRESLGRCVLNRRLWGRQRLWVYSGRGEFHCVTSRTLPDTGEGQRYLF